MWQAVSRPSSTWRPKADRFPTLSALIASGVFEEPNGDPDEDLEFGLQRILDGIEILIRRRSAQLDQM